MAKKMNAFYAQSGGVTAVINASACGVIETARQHKDKIGKVYAGRNGIIGALTEDLIDTSKESAKSAIAALRHTPSGAFGSCRYKLKSLEANRRRVRAPDRGIRRAQHRLLLLQRRRRLRRHLSQGLPAVQEAWATHPGHPRAQDRGQRPADHRQLPRLRLGGQIHRHPPARPAFDVASMCKTSTKVFVLEVMGRHAGWIAAAGGLAADEETATCPSSSCSRKCPSTRKAS
jgi:ATP-dependent phosphofructokinase / diphosphate-dependent phosphofructokinase